jgi:hypothetical protein
MSCSSFRTFPEAAQEEGLWVRELADLLGCEQRVPYCGQHCMPFATVSQWTATPRSATLSPLSFAGATMRAGSR